MKFVVLVTAAAILVAGIATGPVQAASWNWGISTPWFGTQHERSVSSRHLRTRDSIRLGPIEWSGGLNLSADHKSRCAARYRSYNALTDTYVTFGGETRRCRL